MAHPEGSNGQPHERKAIPKGLHGRELAAAITSFIDDALGGSPNPQPEVATRPSVVRTPPDRPLVRGTLAPTLQGSVRPPALIPNKTGHS